MRYRVDVMTEDEEIAQSVEEAGWHAIHIPESPFGPFAYTCGLLPRHGHPELIVFGLAPTTAQAVLAAMVHDIGEGRRFDDPEPVDDVLSDRALATRPVHETQHELFLGYSIGHLRHVGHEGPLVARQVVWSDDEGRLPGEPGCDAAVVRAQPSLHVVRVAPE